MAALANQSRAVLPVTTSEERVRVGVEEPGLPGSPTAATQQGTLEADDGRVELTEVPPNAR